MMSAALRRSPRVDGSKIWTASVISVVAHAALVAGVVLAFMARDREPRLAMTETPDLAEVDLQTSCTGDVLLATAARAALCVAPWGGDLEACGGDLEMSMWIALSGCSARNTSIAEVAMVSPRALEKVQQIDPEQLMEELKEQEKPQPKEVPPPQPEQAQPPAPPPPPPPPPPQTRPSQVVETVKPNDEKEPENARFLAEYNTRVEKQTVARGARSEPMVAKSKPEELTPKEKATEDPSVQKKSEDRPPGANERAPDAPGKLSMRAPGAPSQNQETPQDAKIRGVAGGAKGPIVADGFVPRSGDHAVEQQRRDPGEKTKGLGGAGGGAPPIPDLKPSKEILERAMGGGSVDHLEEVESGDETALTAKRWVYASFFNRLKRQVAQNWDPNSVWRRVDPDGTHHGTKNRVTVVRVSLARRGDLSKIVVTAPSGVGELDEEAVRAFRAAAPFPNPPDGLVKENVITFEFSFYFTVSGSSTSWRVIRQ